MTFYEIYSLVQDCVTENMLTQDEAEERLKLLGRIAIHREMDPDIVDAIQATGLNTCECG